MLKNTHLAAGMAFAVLCSCSAPATILVCVGSLLPDIDTESSTFGRYVRPVSFLLEHRTFTHSLVFAALMTLVSPYLGIGVLSHIIMDMMTQQGVQLLWPFGRKFGIPIISRWIKTGSEGETFIRILLYIIIALEVVYLMVNNSQGGFDELLSAWDVCKENVQNTIQWIKSLLSVDSTAVLGSVEDIIEIEGAV